MASEWNVSVDREKALKDGFVTCVCNVAQKKLIIPRQSHRGFELYPRSTVSEVQGNLTVYFLDPNRISDRISQACFWLNEIFVTENLKARVNYNGHWRDLDPERAKRFAESANEALKEIIEILKKFTIPLVVYVVGSIAAGTPSDSGDTDLDIIVQGDYADICSNSLFEDIEPAFHEIGSKHGFSTAEIFKVYTYYKQ